MLSSLGGASSEHQNVSLPHPTGVTMTHKQHLTGIMTSQQHNPTVVVTTQQHHPSRVTMTHEHHPTGVMTTQQHHPTGIITGQQHHSAEAMMGHSTGVTVTQANSFGHINSAMLNHGIIPADNSPDISSGNKNTQSHTSIHSMYTDTLLKHMHPHIYA